VLVLSQNVDPHVWQINVFADSILTPLYKEKPIRF
jgi:hypothetical protein